MVYSTYFTYDGIYSGQYGLQIVEFTGLNPEPVDENPAFSPSLTTLKVPSLLRFFHGGIDYSSAPQCEIAVVSEQPLGASTRSAILSWLVGRKAFKPLVFSSTELSSYTYYCVFTESSTIYVNGVCHGFRLTALFDSQFARGTPTTLTTTAGGTLTITNNSDVRDGYVYPKIEFNGNISVLNTTDDAQRYFTFENINNDEHIVVDCETKIITSSAGVERFSNFLTKNWLRLRPGVNTLIISRGTGATGAVKITCPTYKMIGY